MLLAIFIRYLKGKFIGLYFPMQLDTIVRYAFNAA